MIIPGLDQVEAAAATLQPLRAWLGKATLVGEGVVTLQR